MQELLAGRYERRSSLGRGAMGEVWLAYDTMLRRHVAVKVLRGGSDLDPHSVERMMREARLAAHLQHPRVVAVHDLLVIDDSPVVIMEYVDGESLAARLTREGRLSLDQAASIGRDVCQALAAAHAAHIIHRDVKPANIMIDRSGRAKLADFGIARGAEETGLTGTGQMIGTVAYMAPEIALGEDPSPAADIYSLGATLYAAVEGRAPFHTAGPRQNTAAMLLRMVREDPPPPRYAGALEPLLTLLLGRDPDQRPDAHAVLTAFAPVTRNPAVAAPPVTPEAALVTPVIVSSSSAPPDAPTEVATVSLVHASTPPPADAGAGAGAHEEEPARLSLLDPDVEATRRRPDVSDFRDEGTSLVQDLERDLPLAETTVRARVPEVGSDAPTTVAPAAQAAVQQQRPARTMKFRTAIAGLVGLVVLLVAVLAQAARSAPGGPMPEGRIALTGTGEVRSLTVVPTDTGLAISVSLAAVPTDSEVWVDLRYSEGARSCPDRAVIFAPAKKTAYVATVQCQANPLVANSEVTLTDRLEPSSTMDATVARQDLALPASAIISARAHLVRAGQSTAWLPSDETYEPLTHGTSPRRTPGATTPPASRPLLPLAPGRVDLIDPAGDGGGHADLVKATVSAEGTAVAVTIELATPDTDSEIWIGFQRSDVDAAVSCPERAVRLRDGGLTAELVTVDCTSGAWEPKAPMSLLGKASLTSRKTSFTTENWPLPEGTRLKVAIRTIHTSSGAIDEMTPAGYVALK